MPVCGGKLLPVYSIIVLPCQLHSWFVSFIWECGFITEKLSENLKNTIDLEEKKRLATKIENMKKEVLKW